MSQEDPHGAPSSGTSHILICLTARSSFRDITLIRFDRAGPLETLSESPTAWTRTPASSQWITRQAHGRFTVDRFYKQWGVADPIPVQRWVADVHVLQETCRHLHCGGTER